ncbi:MAG: EVE domain-containing protein [Gemmataceae bacterium]
MARRSKKQQDPSDVGLWLFKEEPNAYNISQLEQDETTIWDGVKNNLALKNLRRVKPGDRVLYYHTGKEKAIVGEMVVLTDPFPDPNGEDEKLTVVEVKFQRRWTSPLSLKRIKDEESLADWDLVRLPRLSVVPVTPLQWELAEQLAQTSDTNE